MPGPFVKRHKLGDSPIAFNEQMRRHLQAFQVSERVVGRFVEAIGEQLVNKGAAKLAGRQTDTVNHQQIDSRLRWPVIAIEGWDKRRRLKDGRR